MQNTTTKSAPLPNNEQERLKELYSLCLLDSAEEEEYNSLAELVAYITGCPISLVSIMDKDRQWFKAKTGVNEKETSRDVAFCAHTLMQDCIMIVEDATLDERFESNPFVTGSHGFRFYAGVPFYSTNGYKLGTVCVLDNKPQKFSEEKIKALNAAAKQLSKLIELRKRNLQLAELAAQQIKLGNETVKYQIAQHDKERATVGYELHENFAQTISACLHLINTGAAIPELRESNQQKVTEALRDMLESMRSLSKSLQPLGTINVANGERIAQLVATLGTALSLHTDCKCTGNMSNISATQIGSISYIILEQLNAYSVCPNRPAKVCIRIKAGIKVQVSIWAEGCTTETTSTSLMIVRNSIINRCELLGGTASFIHEDGCNKLVAQLPKQ